ncbi:cupin domain-containing protein [Defluviicoccus vanus]|uniref:Cupin domain-containing protein n=1 Tax=Defluviicoccus vanus TaxID=111831 RepID=A0A7H1N2K3_9PROT|nr:cupin domain-containing protein [Defluviicoccus vanus]QNT69939.1 cupin domain-containing protein [Defluviicoccus vanus]
MAITVKKPSEQEIAEMKRLPTWSREASRFDWEYDIEEVCYLLEGDVRVTTTDGQIVEFGPGDLVTFPAGLKCHWNIRRAVRKHYRMG